MTQRQRALWSRNREQAANERGKKCSETKNGGKKHAKQAQKAKEATGQK